MSAPVHGEYLRKVFPGIVKAVDTTAKTIDAIVSTASIDRETEIILPSAWRARLPGYLRNPVFLWSHDPTQLRNYLGRADRVDLVNEGLRALFDCSRAVLIHEDARIAFDLVDAKIISGFSVGFRAWAWCTPASLPTEAQAELEALGIDWSRAKVIYTDCELMEISLCGLPCNRESLVVGRQFAPTEERMSSPLTSPLTTDSGDPKPAAAAPEKAVPTQPEAVGTKTVTKAHPIVEDISARLHRAAYCLEGPWDEPDYRPDAGRAAAVLVILESVIAQLRGFIPAEEVPSTAVTTSAPPAKCKLDGTAVNTSAPPAKSKLDGTPTPNEEPGAVSAPPDPMGFAKCMKTAEQGVRQLVTAMHQLAATSKAYGLEQAMPDDFPSPLDPDDDDDPDADVLEALRSAGYGRPKS